MKNKIIKTFLLTISVLLISEAFLLAVHFVITEKYQRITDNLVSEYQLSKHTSELVNSFYDIIQYSNDEKRVQAFRGHLDNLRSLLAKMDKDLVGNSSWTSYVGTKNTINIVVDEVNNGLNNISAGNFSEVTNNYLKAAKYNNFVKENTSGLLLKELENVEATQAEIAKTKFWSELVAIALFVLLAIGSLIHVFSFSKKLVEPLRRLANISKKIVGNHDTKIDDDLKNSDDEIAVLANSYDSLVNSLKDEAKDIQSKDDQLTQIRKNLAIEGASDGAEEKQTS